MAKQAYRGGKYVDGDCRFTLKEFFELQITQNQLMIEVSLGFGLPESRARFDANQARLAELKDKIHDLI